MVAQLCCVATVYATDFGAISIIDFGAIVPIPLSSLLVVLNRTT